MDIIQTKPIHVRDLGAPVNLHATGDWHVGEAGCAEGRLRRAIDKIASDRSGVALLMGDLGGFIAPDDKRWDARNVAEGLSIADLGDWESLLVERIASIAKPIRKKIIGVLAGNHEKGFSKRHHIDVTHHIGKEIGCPALGYSCLFTLRFVCGKHERELSVYGTHGAGAAMTAGAKLNRLIRYMDIFPYTSLVLSGHMHSGIEYRLPRLYQNGSDIGERLQFGAITGTFLRTYSLGSSGYGEERGYPPSALGHPVISIVPETGDIGVRWA